MSDENSVGIHWSFWVIGVVALIWNLLGVANFFAQMDPEILAGYEESARAIVKGRPGWATVGFAAAVFGGAVGCLLMLLRQSAAFYFFVLSLIGVFAATIHSVSLGIQFKPGEIVLMIVMPIAVAIFLLIYYRFSANKNWIK